MCKNESSYSYNAGERDGKRSVHVYSRKVFLKTSLLADAYRLIQNSPIKSILSNSQHSSPQKSIYVADGHLMDQQSNICQTYAANSRTTSSTGPSPTHQLINYNRGWLQLQPMTHIIRFKNHQDHLPINEKTERHYNQLLHQQQPQSLQFHTATVHG